MTDAMKIPPPRFGPGPVMGPDLEMAWSVFYRDVLARLDLRYKHNDMAAALVAAPDGTVTVGGKAIPSGRTVGVPALTQQISDIGAAKDSRFLPQVSTGNKNSVQNVLPLTAVSDASTAQISIAAHTLQYGWGRVSYSTGTITGLTPSTNYYVYADDPTFQGGATSYFADTNPQTVVTGNGRYYVGSIITAISADSKLITAATSTNPIQFTTSQDFTWSTNDAVVLGSLPGDFGTNLNGHSYAITVINAHTFTIGVDGQTFASYTSGGTATRTSSQTTGGGGGGGGGGHSGGQLP